jgi:aryl-alcohol dehydrogenase-like predicted oxidoreductase
MVNLLKCPEFPPDISLFRPDSDHFHLRRTSAKFAREYPILTVDLVELGKVRYIGASSMYAYQFVGLQYVAEKHGWTKFISMQNQYHLIYREEEREMIPACKELGVGYEIQFSHSNQRCIPWWPLAGGLLARPKDKETTRSSDPFIKSITGSKEWKTYGTKIVDRVEELAEKKGVTMAQLATAWVLSNDSKSIY